MQNGYGTCAYPDGSVYKGKWKDGLRHGEGSLTDPDGDTYTGGWQDDKRHGKGSLTGAKGQSKQGWWVSDKYVGANQPERKEEKDKDFFDTLGGDLEDAANMVSDEDDDEF
jgi:hypothetical protein